MFSRIPAWLRLAAALALLFGALKVPAQSTNQGPRDNVFTVVEVTDQWILLQRPGSLPLRHWFEWAGSENVTPDALTLALAQSLKRGEAVEVHWALNDPERVEFLTSPGAPMERRPPATTTRPVRAAVTLPEPVRSGTTTGLLIERTDEWLLVQPADALPLRHWFKPGDELKRSSAELESGEDVVVRWTFDDRERIQSFRRASATPPSTESPTAMAPAPSGLAEPPTASPDFKPHSVSLAERVNNWVDLSVAFGGRILELPLFVILGSVMVIGTVLGLVTYRFARTRPGLSRGLLVAEVGLVVLTLTLIVDRKIARLQAAFTELQTKTSANASAVLSAVSKFEARRLKFLADPAEVQKNLAKSFRDVSLRPLIYDEATDIIQLHTKSPLVQAYIAIIDLRNPALEIRMDATLDNKRLTTAFAREFDCTVAINGEAGTSPGAASGLGQWRGNMVRRGQILLREDPNIPRPYLAFDRANRATFVAEAARSRILATNTYNAIWGRVDLIVNGVIQGGDVATRSATRQPRTGMAINQDGTLLFLLVADGRQPNYSAGFTQAEVGLCLKAFGAHQAMLCDEGGSACIYLKQFGGIANIPSDNNGEERPTYTHFGIALRAEK